jgi:hypothetical protein
VGRQLVNADDEYFELTQRVGDWPGGDEQDQRDVSSGGRMRQPIDG